MFFFNTTNFLVFFQKKFLGLGFRIEDDVLLTDTGAEVLTANCVRSSDEIEYAMRV